MRSFLLILPLLSANALAAPIDEVHREVAQTMRYQSETGQHIDGSCPPAGDCEDMALCAARKLIERGVARERLAIATGYIPQAHAVLVVDGKYVLDNRLVAPTPVKGYDMAYHTICRLDGMVGVVANGKVVGMTPAKGACARMVAALD